jgi:ribosomal protein L21E
MVNTNGYRRGTRYLFSRKFRHHGKCDCWEVILGVMNPFVNKEWSIYPLT